MSVHTETLRSMLSKKDTLPHPWDADESDIREVSALAPSERSAIEWALSILAPENAEGHANDLSVLAGTYVVVCADACRAGAAALIENPKLRERIAELEAEVLTFHNEKQAWLDSANESAGPYVSWDKYKEMSDKCDALESALHAKENDGER